MWQQIEQRRHLAKSAMAKLVANDEGQKVVAALEFLSPAVLRFRTALLALA
jgi:hypothetical protein